MATDCATPVDTESTDAESAAYISPAADFLLLSVLTAGIALAGAAVIIP